MEHGIRNNVIEDSLSGKDSVRGKNSRSVKDHIEDSINLEDRGGVEAY
jgi:hypothetical protein